MVGLLYLLSQFEFGEDEKGVPMQSGNRNMQGAPIPSQMLHPPSHRFTYPSGKKHAKYRFALIENLTSSAMVVSVRSY